MKLPRAVPVMTLPNATLFPEALLPLHIFEPRYRRMLADVLASHRMFCVAMQKPGCRQERPLTVAGLGMVRAAVKNADGTFHLVLQGLTRVAFGAVERYRPYRVQVIYPVQSPPWDAAAAATLVGQVRDLLNRRFQSQPPPSLSFSPPPTAAGLATPAPPSPQELFHYLETLTGPERFADLVSCALLREPDKRQKILETANIEGRLQHLLRFLLAEFRPPTH